MSDAANAVSAGPPPSADPHDPLPEGRFLYRRLLAYAVAVAVLVLLWRIVDGARDLGAGDPAQALDVFAGMFAGLLWFLWAVLTYYLVAPSAEQITKFIQVGAALRSGVVFRTAARAEGANGRAVATSAAGRAETASHDRWQEPSRPYEGPDEPPEAMDDTPEDTPWR